MHGSDMAIHDALSLMPIHQDLPIGTEYRLSFPTNEANHSITVLSEHLKAVGGKTKSGATGATSGSGVGGKYLPFNRRNYLMALLPRESLSASFRVEWESHMSLRERTHWWPLADGVVIGTQLDTPPMTVLKRIVAEQRAKIHETVNNSFEMFLRRAGLIERIDDVRSTILSLFDEIDVHRP